MIPTFVIESFVAGILASIACGVGVLPLAFKRIDPSKHAGLAFGIASGLMFSASVYNLILPGLTIGNSEIDLRQATLVVSGIILGALFLSYTDKYLSHEKIENSALSKWGNKAQILIFIAMCVHSIPEGVAVGVGYSSDAVYDNNLGHYIALAIAIHNIPEGLAVAIPMRAAGASITKCFIAAFLTSIPQPIAAVPAAYLAWFFQPIMPVLMGFAAGAMIFLVVLELIPDALETENPKRTSWAFIIGFSVMILIQVLL